MAKEQYKYVEVQIPATPRNKRLTDSIQAAAQTGGGGGGGYPSTPQYWELVTVKEDGTVLEESQYYLRPISAKNIVAPGDIVAFADGGEYASGLPVADYNTFGLFKAKQGGGLLFDVNEGWYVDPEFAGGIDEEQLKQYLTDNNYITVDYLTKQGYLTLSSPLTGYTKPDAYSPIAATDTILSAIGKLERNFDNYVDLTTNQTIGGVKTFNENVLSKKDIIAFADGGEYASGLPVADTVTYGLVKVDGTTVRINASGQLEADAGGGIDFTVGTGLDLSVASVLSVKYGTTAGTACQGNDSRLHTHNNKSILDGITSGLISNWNTAYTNNHTHSNKTVLDGISSTKVSHWDTAYTNNHTHSNKSYLDVINQNLSNTSSPNFRNLTVDINIVAKEDIYANNNMYTQTLQAYTAVNTKNVTASGYVKAQGDVIAYADGGEYASGLPVADTYTYGLIKYDGTTIGKNSSGQLYVINSGGTGGSTVSWGTESYKVVPLTVNGVSKTVTLSGHTHEWDTAITNKPTWLNSNTKPTYTWSEITNKPGWIGSSKPSYSWSEITGKPNVITSISVSKSGSGNAVGSLSVSGSTIYYNMTTISGGSGSWNGGTVTNDIVISKTNGTLRLYSGRNNWALWCDGSSNYTFRANYNSTEMFAINTSGGWWFKGSQQSSDLRKKDIVGYVQDVLDKMIHISVIRFRWNDNPYDDGSIHIGLGAQIVKPYFPDAVGIWDDSLTIDYSAMGCIAFQGVKELYTRFLPVENKVKILESRVHNLQLRLDNAYREIFELKRQMGGAA